MTDKKPIEKPKSEVMGSASRRDFMKVAGIGALGLAYASPIVETLHGYGNMTSYSMTKLTKNGPPNDQQAQAITTDGHHTSRPRSGSQGEGELA